MLDREIEPHWSIIKESYPDAVVFHEVDGVYLVKGQDTGVLAKEFGIDSGSPWYAFDEGQAWGYMSELAKRGHTVVRATNGCVATVAPPADRRRERERQRRKAVFVAIEPQLLIDERDVQKAANPRWLAQHRYEALFEEFKRWLRDDDLRSLRAYGEPYIYRVGEWYELDLDLTSMLEPHVLLLAKAALATGCKMPCRLLEPPSRRNHRRKSVTRVAANHEPSPRLGQMTFDGF
jgi:hypothetical protein